MEVAGQWRTAGLGGLMGLDYTPLFMRMERMRLEDADWELLFADVQVIEASALKTIKANSKDGDKQQP